MFNAQGKRNVWIAEPGPASSGYTARPITKYSEDDGQDIGELVFTPDAESVIYTRGGDLEMGEKSYPNPSQLVGGTEQDLWSVHLNGGEPRKLGEGHSAAVSPKGDAIAYILKGQIWVAKLDGSEKPQQLVHTHKAGLLRLTKPKWLGVTVEYSGKGADDSYFFLTTTFRAEFTPTGMSY